MKVSLGGQSDEHVRSGFDPVKLVSEMLASAVRVARAFCIFYAGGEHRGSRVIHRVDGFEFVSLVKLLLNTNEYPLETAHFPVSLSAVVVK